MYGVDNASGFVHGKIATTIPLPIERVLKTEIVIVFVSALNYIIQIMVPINKSRKKLAAILPKKIKNNTSE